MLELPRRVHQRAEVVVGPGGGVVFYDAGSVQSWGRFLEAAPAGWSGTGEDPRVQWCRTDSAGSSKSLPTGTEIGSGGANSTVIIAACGSGTAAGVAAAYRGGGLADWFLPSKDELNALYEQRSMVVGLAGGLFWSSSQSSGNADAAWGRNFTDGYQFDLNEGNDLRVRPVRAF